MSKVWESIPAFLLFVGGFAISIMATEFFFSGQRFTQSELPARIQTLTNSLNSAAETIGQIEAEIKQRQVLVEKLEHDAETASKLAVLNKDQLDAVAQVLKGEIQADQRQNFWTTQAWAFFYTALGFGLSEGYRFFLRWRMRRKLQSVA
jgi:hypothetical protein